MLSEPGVLENSVSVPVSNPAIQNVFHDPGR
jgi:hypothetical protein